MFDIRIANILTTSEEVKHPVQIPDPSSTQSQKFMQMMALRQAEQKQAEQEAEAASRAQAAAAQRRRQQASATTPPPARPTQPQKPTQQKQQSQQVKRELHRERNAANKKGESSTKAGNTEDEVNDNVGSSREYYEKGNGNGDTQHQHEQEKDSENKGESDPQGTQSSAVNNGELDCDALAEEILPKSADNGIFEVLMPNGQTMGVVVNTHPNGTSLLLSPSDEKLAEKLKLQRTELEALLGRRMNRNVEINIL